MLTLVVSDLHLGAASGVDLLRRPELRAALLERCAEADRVVLLGDVLELRHGPRHEALAAARPFFEDLGGVLAGREVVALAGNHDHALVEPWLQRRGELPGQQPLGVEQRFAAAAGSTMLAQLASWAQPARLSVAYPGLWLREDVYATHGHYLDCHLTIPTMERLGIGAMGRLLRRPARGFSSPEDYEAVTVPVFAWIDAIARQARTGEALNGGLTVRAWHALNGEESRNGGGLARTLRARALAAGFPLAVAALNRAGLGPFNADISTGELRRAGLRAMGEVAARLGLGEAHVIFGHTHRAGPLPGDAESEWRGSGGARLMNTGCWTYDGYFLRSAPAGGPYWPGTCVAVEDDGPPRLLGLLSGRTHAELRPATA
ncbi:MAG TPA: hypothetical protein VMU32_04405 [Solirubrobacteraceae bacterium]|nr:hypothetical protein [Solirubrobacteraceae bacterium]